jgi:hypothetical protein
MTAMAERVRLVHAFLANVNRDHVYGLSISMIKVARANGPRIFLEAS